MEKSNKVPELDMFTLLNPEFYGVTENQFNQKSEEESGASPDIDGESDN